MAFLLPCPSCARHVRRTESVCPFCAASVAFEDAPLPRLPDQRLGRAATFAFGAAMTTVAACSGNVAPAYGAPAPDAATAVDGGGSVDAASTDDAASTVDAASSIDANIDTGSTAAAYGISPFDAGVDTGGSSSDYGAPPPP